MIDNIVEKVRGVIEESFDVIDVSDVPDIDDSRITFGNKGLRFEATALYIDMRGSTAVLNKHNRTTVAKIHKAYFHTIVTIARAYGGQVRSFNGDGMLVFFQGTTKNSLSNAVESALKMRWALSSPDSGVKKMMQKYSSPDFGIGIDDGKILCTKVGVSGLNNRDLVWVGNAVNKSVKIGDMQNGMIGISDYVYSNLLDNVKYAVVKDMWGSEVNKNMWEPRYFEYNGNHSVYYVTDYHWVME